MTADPHRFPVGSIVLVPMRVTAHRDPGVHDRDGRPDGTPAAIEVATLGDPVAIVALDADDLAAAMPSSLVAAVTRMANDLTGTGGLDALQATLDRYGIDRPIVTAIGALAKALAAS